MKAILRQSGLLLIALAAIYGALLAVTLVVVPRPDEAAGLDTATAGQTLFMTEPKYIYLNRRQLRSEVPQVVLLGASNVVVGLRQPEVASLVKGATVHNLAIGGANMTEVQQVFDLVHEMQSPAGRHRTVYVVGIWYGMFFENRQHWYTPDRHPGDTDIDIERLRYGFCRRGASGVVSVLPPAYLDVASCCSRRCRSAASSNATIRWWPSRIARRPSTIGARRSVVPPIWPRSSSSCCTRRSRRCWRRGLA